MTTTFLSLGSNEGDRKAWIERAISMIEEQCGTMLIKSGFYETAAWGVRDQADFLNMVMAIHTVLKPEQLLETVLGIEKILGRHRDKKWGPRIIDIDILFYDDVVMTSAELSIPHPFIQDRRFILVPLVEIAPGYVHPILNKTAAQLLSECPDPLEVRSYDGKNS